MVRTSNIFENGNYVGFIELFKVLKMLDTKLVTCCLRDMKDDDVFGGSYKY